MTDFILEDLKNSLIIQIFEAERNLFIWKNVAENIDYLITQPKDIQDLYSFIQTSSQTNFILALGKLYDKPKKYPTQGIIYFLQQLRKKVDDDIEIIERYQTKNVLNYFNAPKYLVNAVDSKDKSEFPKNFVHYYLDKIHSNEVQSDIGELKTMRDKCVAHNEVSPKVTLTADVIDRLLKFATEIVSIFGIAYHSTIWIQKELSVMKRDAEREAYFIKSTIDKLKSI